MLSYLPEIYPDELVYSWFCRYYVHSGCLSHNMALSDIYCLSSDSPSKEFLGHLNSDIKRKIQGIHTMNKLILKHTMFPQYARFISFESKKNAVNRLKHDFCDVHQLFSVPPRTGTDRYLKYCPICAEEDRQKYGEAYWHRSHQIRNMQLCCKHNCMLESSAVTANSERTFTFCPAEVYAIKKNTVLCENDSLINYNRYLCDVFNAPIDFVSAIPIHIALFNALEGTKYVKNSGKCRNTKLLSDDIKVFYKDTGIDANFYQLQRVLLGKTFDFSVVCQIAFYLKVSIKNLTAPNIKTEQIKKEQFTHYNSDKPPIHWKEFDNKLAPVFEQTAYDIYIGNTNSLQKPTKVSLRRICNEVGIQPHQISKLPKCKTILEKYTETAEANMARRIVWAYKRLKSEQSDKIYWSDLRSLAGVKRANIGKVIPYIYKADTNIADEIVSIL